MVMLGMIVRVPHEQYPVLPIRADQGIQSGLWGPLWLKLAFGVHTWIAFAV